MSNLFFTLFVNISLSPGNSCYFWGNWVSLDQICALIFFFFCYYPKAIVIILQAAGQRDRIEYILLDFMGQFIIFLEGGGQDCIFWGKLKIFFVYTHTKNFFLSKFWGGGGVGGDGPHHPRPRLGSSLHVLLLRFSHVFFLLLFFS